MCSACLHRTLRLSPIQYQNPVPRQEVACSYIVLCKAAVQEVFGSLKNRILLLTLVEVALVLYSTETYDYFIFLFCFVQIVNAD